MRHRTIATLVLLLVFGRSSAQVSRRAQSLPGQMKLEEKIGQLNLAAGVGLDLRFSLRRDELKFWSPRTKRWVVEPSIFDVWAGEDSRADLHAELTIEP